MNIEEFKTTFNGQIGINAQALFDELDRLASKMNIPLGGQLTDAFLSQARHIYAAYLAQVSANILEVGLQEFMELYKTGRTPKRPKRVGASTA